MLVGVLEEMRHLHIRSLPQLLIDLVHRLIHLEQGRKLGVRVGCLKLCVERLYLCDDSVLVLLVHILQLLVLRCVLEVVCEGTLHLGVHEVDPLLVPRFGLGLVSDGSRHYGNLTEA